MYRLRAELRTSINWFLLPIDLAGFCFWLVGFFGNNIAWPGGDIISTRTGRFKLLGSETDA
jgi:hypothetical protein